MNVQNVQRKIKSAGSALSAWSVMALLYLLGGAYFVVYFGLMVAMAVTWLMAVWKGLGGLFSREPVVFFAGYFFGFGEHAAHKGMDSSLFPSMALWMTGLTAIWMMTPILLLRWWEGPSSKPWDRDPLLHLGQVLGAGSLLIYLLVLIGPIAPLSTHLILLTGTALGFWANRLYERKHASEASKVQDQRHVRASTQGSNATSTPATSPSMAEKPQEPEIAPARQSLPSISFMDIYGNQEIKQRLKAAAQKILQPRSTPSSSSDPRNGILLFGEPGNGKTIFAEALAGEFKIPLITIAYADLASRWIGHQSEGIRGAFRQAINAAPCVLFIDEIDSFLESRENSLSSVKEDRDIVNALLTLMVDLRRHQVILMAATNHMGRLDSAGVREGRFDFKIEITPPDAAARVGLLASGLQKNLPGVHVAQDLINRVAQRWNGYSVKRILAVAEELPSYLERRGKSSQHLSFEDFTATLQVLQGHAGMKLENVIDLKDLALSENTWAVVRMIVNRLKDPERTERHGGSLPTGVLFYGLPGTGKTATAKAIAREVQWGFLSKTGGELVRDPRELDKLYRQAKDNRPCLIFIDEADELLKSREYSHQTEATNKLLTLMDGAGDRVKDVVWLAATNHPEQIDTALLRSGRFTEKVVFELPSLEMITRHLSKWLVQHKVSLEPHLTARTIAVMMGEQSMADAQGIVQTALNSTIARNQDHVIVTRADIEQAMQTVLGGVHHG